MFELSFGKLLLIAITALIVLGPERLPTVARTLGALIGRAQRFVNSVKAEIQSEVGASGLGNLRQDLQDAANAFHQRFESEAREINQQLNVIPQEFANAAKEAQASVVQPGQTQVTPAQLAALEAAHAEAGLPPPFLHEPRADTLPVAASADEAYPLFAAQPGECEPAPSNAVVVNENQLDLFADPPPVAVPPAAPSSRQQ